MTKNIHETVLSFNEPTATSYNSLNCSAHFATTAPRKKQCHPHSTLESNLIQVQANLKVMRYIIWANSYAN